MRIYLLRHGHTIAGLHQNAVLGVPDPPLDEFVIQQAESLGQRLQHYEIDAVYSSDLKRAAETAQIICRYTHHDILYSPQLREINMGDIPVQGWKAFPDYYLEWQKHEADLPYPQGEAGADVQKRVWPLLEEIVKKHSRDVAVVTHGGVIMILLSACIGSGLEKRFRFAPPAYCSISALSYDPNDSMWRVEQFNDTAHLSLITAYL